MPDAVGVNFTLLTSCYSEFREEGVAPVTIGLDFEILVAQVIGDDVFADSDPTFDKLDMYASVVVECRNLLSGSRICLGPYGDLLYRVLVGYGAVVELVASQMYGVVPAPVDPATTAPPHEWILSGFLNRSGQRFAEALAGDPLGTEDGELTATLRDLANRLGHELPLIAALVGQTPLVTRVHAPDWPGSWPYSEYLELTGDEELSRGLANAEPL
jgi:hypothetical protein